jgi:hypothetical protein
MKINFIFIFVFFSYILTYVYGAQNIYCTGHDACRNNVWNGEYNIFCGASNSERTCKSTTLNCGSGKDCTIKTQGSGHDAYQYSTVNAKESNSFKLTCQASGLRDCKSITIWCPQASGSTCECVSCPSTVTMKCVSGVSCSSVSNANINYVASEITTQSNNNDNNNDNNNNNTCYKNVTLYNYKNVTLYNYKNITRYIYKNVTLYIYKNVTLYNYKNVTLYNYKNKTLYNNGTLYKNIVRFINKTNFEEIMVPIYINNETVKYIIKKTPSENNIINIFYMIGFFVLLGTHICCIILLIIKCNNDKYSD